MLAVTLHTGPSEAARCPVKGDRVQQSGDKHLAFDLPPDILGDLLAFIFTFKPVNSFFYLWFSTLLIPQGSTEHHISVCYSRNTNYQKSSAAPLCLADFTPTLLISLLFLYNREQEVINYKAIVQFSWEGSSVPLCRVLYLRFTGPINENYCSYASSVLFSGWQESHTLHIPPLAGNCHEDVHTRG